MMLETKFGMKYPFPHTLVHIVDNSSYTGELPVVLADNPSMYGTLVVSGFPMGEDNRVIAIDRSDILNVAFGLNKIGTSEIKKYGQTITYPLSLIDQGAPIQLMRVTPSDATYAYSCISIEWRWDPETMKVHVRYVTDVRMENDRDLANYKNRDRLAAAVMKYVKNDAVKDKDGTIWTRRAFIVNVSAGRGSAYNKYTTAINQTIQGKRPANVRYLFSTIDTSTNNTVEQFHASLINTNSNRYDAIDSVNVIVKKRADGSSIVVPYVNEEAIQELYAFYREKYEAMLNDNAHVTDEKERQAFIGMNINTFDPIFGLYLYDGTDETSKLPFFQVDMRDVDIPVLLESDRIYYAAPEAGEDPVDEPSLILDRKLMALTTGITNEGNPVYIGDVYIYGGETNNNNPWLYFVAAINQYSGSVTTVRTNMLNIGWDSSSKTTRRLATIIDSAQTISSFANEAQNKIRADYVREGEVIARYESATSSWKFYIAISGPKTLKDAARDGDIVTDILQNQTTPENWSYLKEVIPTGYDFIAWDTINNVSNIVGINDTDTAWIRQGATCIDPDVPFGDDSTAIWVNGYVTPDPTATPPTTGDKKYVINRTWDKIAHYGNPPANTVLMTDNSFVDNRHQYDTIAYDPDVITVERFITSTPYSDNEKYTNIKILVKNPPVTTVSTLDQDLNWASPFPARYVGIELPTGGTAGSYTTSLFKFDLVKHYGDWGDNASQYWYDLKPLFNADDLNILKEYITNLTPTGPSGNQLPAGILKWYVARVVYKAYYDDGEFYDDETVRTDDHKLTGDIENLYFDITTNKWYMWNGSSYSLEEYLVDEYQILRLYATKDATTPDETKPGTLTKLGGFNFIVNLTSETYTTSTYPIEPALELDPNVNTAEYINRYSVIGTIGSLYRVQKNAIQIPSNYYDDSYGVNITSAAGGVALAEGSTGFFDKALSSIEFKWNYMKLMVDAFRGKIDPRIKSPNRTPAKFLFDGGWNTIIGQASMSTMDYTAADLISASTIFTEDEKDEVLFNPNATANLSLNGGSIDVKQAMYDLMIYRVYQCIPEDKRPLGPGSGLSLHLDAGVTDVQTASLINNSFTRRFDNPNASWDIGGYVSSIDGLSYTYAKRLADNLIAHCKSFTINKPYTKTYSKIERNEYVSYFPDIDMTDWDYRELMYNSGGNAWLPDVNGNLMRSSQRTLMRGSDTSDLLQESNMRTLSQLVYLLQNKLEEKLFEYNDDSVLRTMQDEVTNMFSNWVGNLVESLNIYFERDINPDDGGEVVVCYVDVVFRGINLRIPIIVNVNRRTITTS